MDNNEIDSWMLSDLLEMEGYLILEQIDDWTPQDAEDAFDEMDVIEI